MDGSSQLPLQQVSAAPHLRDEVDEVPKLAAILGGLEQEELQAGLVVPPLQLELVRVARRVALDVALQRDARNQMHMRAARAKAQAAGGGSGSGGGGRGGSNACVLELCHRGVVLYASGWLCLEHAQLLVEAAHFAALPERSPAGSSAPAASTNRLPIPTWRLSRSGAPFPAAPPVAQLQPSLCAGCVL